MKFEDAFLGTASPNILDVSLLPHRRITGSFTMPFTNNVPLTDCARKVGLKRGGKALVSSGYHRLTAHFMGVIFLTARCW